MDTTPPPTVPQLFAFGEASKQIDHLLRGEPFFLRTFIRDIRAELIGYAMVRTDGNLQAAARMLGLKRAGLVHHVETLGLGKPKRAYRKKTDEMLT